MGKHAATFATMIREAVRGFRHFCEHCNRETWWSFAAEAGAFEYYECSECKNQKGWKVR